MVPAKTVEHDDEGESHPWAVSGRVGNGVADDLTTSGRVELARYRRARGLDEIERWNVHRTCTIEFVEYGLARENTVRHQLRTCHPSG